MPILQAFLEIPQSFTGTGGVVWRQDRRAEGEDEMSGQWQIIGRHNNWVLGASIAEMVNSITSERRFVATVRGYRNFRIFEGVVGPETSTMVQRVVTEIRDRIDSGNNSVFVDPQFCRAEAGMSEVRRWTK